MMLSKKQVVERIGLSAVTIWRRIRAGDFPKPVQLTPNRIGWRDEDLEKWEASRPVGQMELPENLKKEIIFPPKEKPNAKTKTPEPAETGETGQKTM